MGYSELYLSLDTRAHCTPETVHLRYAKMITSNHFGISYACHIAYDFFVSIEASPCMCKCMETTWKQMFESTSDNHLTIQYSIPSQIAKFMVPTWGPPGSCPDPDGPHVGPMNPAIRDVPLPPRCHKDRQSCIQTLRYCMGYIPKLGHYSSRCQPGAENAFPVKPIT